MTRTHPALGKPHLFGEHPVVYGMRAIASAINLPHHRDSRRSEPDYIR